MSKTWTIFPLSQSKIRWKNNRQIGWSLSREQWVEKLRPRLDKAIIKKIWCLGNRARELVLVSRNINRTTWVLKWLRRRSIVQEWTHTIHKFAWSLLSRKGRLALSLCQWSPIVKYVNYDKYSLYFFPNSHIFWNANIGGEFEIRTDLLAVPTFPSK